MKMNYCNDIILENKYNMKKKWYNLSNIVDKQNNKSTFSATFVFKGQFVINKLNIAEFFIITLPKLD